MDEQATDLSEYLSQHYEELNAYLSGLFGSTNFANEITQDLLFYLWNSPVKLCVGNPMAQLLSMANRLGQYRKRQRLSPPGGHARRREPIPPAMFNY